MCRRAVTLVTITGLAIAACGDDGGAPSPDHVERDGAQTFVIRSEVDPDRPLAVEVSVEAPSAWPPPTLNHYGEPRFDLGGGRHAALSVTQVSAAGTDARARLDAVERDQLFPSSVQREDLGDGRRSFAEATGGDTRGWLHVAGPEDSVLICSFFVRNAERRNAQAFCRSAAIVESGRARH